MADESQCEVSEPIGGSEGHGDAAGQPALAPRVVAGISQRKRMPERNSLSVSSLCSLPAGDLAPETTERFLSEVVQNLGTASGAVWTSEEIGHTRSSR